MSPEQICRIVYDAGMTLRLRNANLVLAPADKLTPDMRALLVEHKLAVIQFLQQAHATSAAVINAAMRACDQYGDEDHAKAEMVRDIEATPPHLIADLLAHFKSARGGVQK
jgi:TubC N-terminal docking domain